MKNSNPFLILPNGNAIHIEAIEAVCVLPESPSTDEEPWIPPRVSIKAGSVHQLIKCETIQGAERTRDQVLAKIGEFYD